MSVSIMEIGRLTNGTVVPGTEYEEPFGQTENRLTLPFPVLWDQARSGITKLVHFSYQNLHEILGQGEVEISNLPEASTPRTRQLNINSRVISASFGRGRRIQFPNSVSVELAHLQVSLYLVSMQRVLGLPSVATFL